ncbi:MAG: Crp/Fnr family transcriptional regulator, partial [Sphingobacteriales bacterium]
MFTALIKNIQDLTACTNQETGQIIEFFSSIHFKKKQIVLEEGQVCKQHYFVENGLLRMYYINEKGVEHTTQFALENWWITDHMSFQKRLPSGFYIQAVESSSVSAISFDDQEHLLAKHPAMEKYFRIVYQRAYAANQFRIKYIYDLSKEEMYDTFASKNPEFVQRIPQYLLASFLGFTPEYLSKIRRKR